MVLLLMLCDDRALEKVRCAGKNVVRRKTADEAEFLRRTWYIFYARRKIQRTPSSRFDLKQGRTQREEQPQHSHTIDSMFM